MRSAIALLGLAAALPAGAQAPVPDGAQFQINTYTTHNQNYSSVATDADGDFVVVWQSYGSSGTDTSLYSIQGQRYASDGSPQGAEFQVNTYTTVDQQNPSVAVDAGGGFFVVWESRGSPGTDTSATSVQGQRYASDGSTQGGQFQINAYSTERQVFPSVAAAPGGEFVVVWASSGSNGTDTSSSSIQGQRYASDGSAQGGEFQVNSYTTNYQGTATVAAAADGDFVVAWVSRGSFGTDNFYGSIQGQRYASTGSTQGGQFQVNTFTTFIQIDASVAMADAGDFVVVWRSVGSYGTDQSDYSLQGQRYASDGSMQGGQFQVNTYTTDDQRSPTAAMDADGGFVVTWSRAKPLFGFGPQSIQGQRYASDGSTLGGEFQVNSVASDYQFAPSVAARDGDFVVAWTSFGTLGTDTSSLALQGQRYSLPTPVPLGVPAMSPAARFALGAVLMLLGAGYALRRRAARREPARAAQA
ncbi:MAG TPA: hypothetical protein VII72_03435 [Myxococcota bacterium]|jgi:hypothetical protein